MNTTNRIQDVAELGNILEGTAFINNGKDCGYYVILDELDRTFGVKKIEDYFSKFEAPFDYAGVKVEQNPNGEFTVSFDHIQKALNTDGKEITIEVLKGNVVIEQGEFTTIWLKCKDRY